MDAWINHETDAWINHKPIQAYSWIMLINNERFLGDCKTFSEYRTTPYQYNMMMMMIFLEWILFVALPFKFWSLHFKHWIRSFQLFKENAHFVLKIKLRILAQIHEEQNISIVSGMQKSL